MCVAFTALGAMFFDLTLLGPSSVAAQATPPVRATKSARLAHTFAYVR
jgi:hypothetical protein